MFGNRSNILFFLMLIVALVLGITGCASNPPPLPYVPDEASAKSMTPQEARNLLYTNLRPHGPGRGNPTLNDIGITNIQIHTLSMAISTSEPSTQVFPFKNLAVRVQFWGPTATAWSTPASSGVYLGKGYDQRIDFAGRSNDGLAKNIAIALVVLKRAALEREAAEADVSSFEKTASAYRQAIDKPVIPEEARAYSVQAESAVSDKQFDEAADLYGNAIRIAPWWPSAHFNSAVLFGETGDYALAVGEMKRYLALVPDAPNARAAQDKIYDWEHKMSKPN